MSDFYLHILYNINHGPESGYSERNQGSLNIFLVESSSDGSGLPRQ